MAEQGWLFSPHLSYHGVLSVEGSRVKELRIMANFGEPSGESDQWLDHYTGLSPLQVNSLIRRLKTVIHESWYLTDHGCIKQLAWWMHAFGQSVVTFNMVWNKWKKSKLRLWSHFNWGISYSLDCTHPSLILSICIAYLPFNQLHDLFYIAYLTVKAESHYCLQTVEDDLSLIQPSCPNLLTWLWEQSWQDGRLNLGWGGMEWDHRGFLLWHRFLYRFSWFLSLSHIPFKKRSWEYLTGLITTTGEISLYVNLHMAKWCDCLSLCLCFCEEREPLALTRFLKYTQVLYTINSDTTSMSSHDCDRKRQNVFKMWHS